MTKICRLDFDELCTISGVLQTFHRRREVRWPRGHIQFDAFVALLRQGDATDE